MSFTAAFPKLYLHKKGDGGAPSAKMNFKELATFTTTFVAYQYTIGYDVVVTPDSTVKLTTLRCKANHCLFHISAEQKHFPQKTGAPINGWAIVEADYCPSHTHPPAYEPLNLDAENARRSQPLPAGYATQLVARRPFVDLLDSIDPDLRQYIPQLERLGLLEATLEVMFDIDDTTMKAVLAEKEGIPAFAKVLIREGLRKARERSEAGATVANGRIATEREAARMREWIEVVLAAPSVTIH